MIPSFHDKTNVVSFSLLLVSWVHFAFCVMNMKMKRELSHLFNQLNPLKFTQSKIILVSIAGSKSSSVEGQLIVKISMF